MTEPTEYEIEFVDFDHEHATDRVLTLHRKPGGAHALYYARSGTAYRRMVRVPWDRLTETLVGDVVFVPADPVPQPGCGEMLTVEPVNDDFAEGRYRACDGELAVNYLIRVKRDADPLLGQLSVQARLSRLAPPGQQSERYMRTVRPQRLERTEMSLTEIGDELARATGKKKWRTPGAAWTLVVRKKAIPARELDWPANIRTGVRATGEHNLGKDPVFGRETTYVGGRRGWRVKRSDFEEYLVREHSVDIEEHHRWLRGEA